MIIKQKFDERMCENIARNCGSKSVKNSIAWLRKANYNNPDKFVCEIIDDSAFWAGNICRNHLRLYEIAVLQDAQNKGYGRLCIMRMIALCKKHNLSKITFRTSKTENAINFYKHFGATIVADKQKDWEVEIKV